MANIWFKKIAVACATILLSWCTLAQDSLVRTAFIGIMPSDANDDKVVIEGLHPLGSAKLMGLQKGDTIAGINGQAVESFSQLVSFLKEIQEGQPLTVNIIRNNQSQVIKALAQGKPKEAGEAFDVEYSSFVWQQERIRTITYHPHQQRNDKAAVFFIQGYTCGSIDYGMMPNVSITQLLSGFAQAGFTVFKMEKPGVGDSQGKLACTEYDFNTENEAFTAGLTHFKETKRVDPNKVFVFGHSLGVLHSAILAHQGLVTGVMGYGGVVKPWHDYMHDIYAKQSTMYWGVSEQQAKQNVELISPFLYSWLKTDTDWQVMMTLPSTKKMIEASILPIQDELVFNRHYRFFRSLNQIDFVPLWQNTKAHNLMLHGSFDIQAINGDWAEQVQKLTVKKSGYSSTVKEFEHTDHSLMRYQTKQQLMQSTRGEVRGLGKFNPNITKASIDWMQQILGS